MGTMNRSLCVVAALAIVGSTAMATAQTSVGTFQNWQVLISNEPDGKMCFVANTQRPESKYSQPVTSRDPVYFMVTSIPAKKIKNEVSTIIGYAFGPNTSVQLDIDGNKYTMFTANTDTAWAMPEQEPALVNALKAGAKLTVTGASKRGTVTTDTYSLVGITAAINKMAQECP
jgi:hypothetical protein